jgi:Uncharacterized membrane protein (homolog of Drosophila rhomboid)
MRLSGRKASLLTRTWAPSQGIVLISLIAVQTILFVVQLIISEWDGAFITEYLAVSDRGISQAYAWQFFTAPFLHISIWHFLANVILLYVVGRDVNAIIGERRFLFLYFFGLFAGELGHLFLMPTDSILFAASGGVAAVCVAYATMLPELELTTLLLFMVPVRLKMRRVAQIALLIGTGLLIFDRSGPVAHSVFIGGAAAGWIYAHLLGFGRASFLQRTWRSRAREAERVRSLTTDQFLAEKVDPLLEKISTQGLGSLSRRERRLLAEAGTRMQGQSET